jgi:hypothetical protein
MKSYVSVVSFSEKVCIQISYEASTRRLKMVNEGAPRSSVVECALLISEVRKRRQRNRAAVSKAGTQTLPQDCQPVCFSLVTHNNL